MNSKKVAEIIRRPAWRSLILRQVGIILKRADNIALTDHDIMAVMKAAREIRDICNVRWV
jgi:hypothetical protein